MTSVAAVDCGSNSTRLLIVDAQGHALRREMRITRLSQGVDATGELTDAGMERCLAVLREYRGLMDAHHVTSGLAVATSAVRDASNGGDFLRAIAATVGFRAECLDGEREAIFSLRGATRELAPVATPSMIVDIGGGSTELAAEIDGELVAHSMQLGCVRVTERTLGSRPVTPERARATASMISAELDRAFSEAPRLLELVGRVRLVGLAGTVATLAQLVAGRSGYDRDAVHHQHLTLDQVAYWRDALAFRTPAQRLALPGMEPGREDVLTAGLFILKAVCERFKVTSFITSEDDIMDGVAASLLASDEMSATNDTVKKASE